jgi:hypothetical protein
MSLCLPDQGMCLQTWVVAACHSELGVGGGKERDPSGSSAAFTLYIRIKGRIALLLGIQSSSSVARISIR